MSKRRAVILSVVVEGLSQAETARLYSVSEATVSRLLARYRQEGDAAFEPRSRRPKTSPTETPARVVELIVNLRRELAAQGLDAGPATIAWHLETHHATAVSIATIRRRLLAAGLITPEPRKRPKSSYIRFEADLPNETWQSDFTHWSLADGTDTEILSWLDDHSRYALSITAHQPVTGDAVVDTFLDTTADQGFPASVLTDNALVYTVRFAGFPGGRNKLEVTLAALGITQKHSRPNHPTTCGKVERFQQTLKRWLRQQPPATDLAALQAQLDAFADEYNHRRPHGSLDRRTPAVVYDLLPKTGPTGTGAGPHHRVRHDHVDTTGAISLRRGGRMHHIGIGRAHAGTPVILLINDLDIRVVDRNTGELLRRLTLDPTRNYQPRGTQNAKDRT
jgi:transposase InsO family protein